MTQSSNKILVTGGAGYIGSHIVENLVKEKKKVLINFEKKYRDLLEPAFPYISRNKDLNRYLEN